MNNFNFQTLFSISDMIGEGLTPESTAAALDTLLNATQALLETVQAQDATIKELNGKLYAIAPALEIYETVTQDPEEIRAMLDRYVVKNPDWEHDQRTYQPDKIIDEMAQAAKDPEAKDVLQTLYEDYGAAYITDLYKHWKGIDPYSNLIHNLMMDTEGATLQETDNT